MKIYKLTFSLVILKGCQTKMVNESFCSKAAIEEWASTFGDPRQENGKTPPESVSVTNSKLLIRHESTTDIYSIYMTGPRAVGYRTPIHLHQPGPQLICVHKGRVEPRLEGEENQTYGEGECYEMPANKKMTAVNVGTAPYWVFDIFRLVPGCPGWTPVEPGWKNSVQVRI